MISVKSPPSAAMAPGLAMMPDPITFPTTTARAVAGPMARSNVAPEGCFLPGSGGESEGESGSVKSKAVASRGVDNKRNRSPVNQDYHTGRRGNRVRRASQARRRR